MRHALAGRRTLESKLQAKMHTLHTHTHVRAHRHNRGHLDAEVASSLELQQPPARALGGQLAHHASVLRRGSLHQPRRQVDAVPLHTRIHEEGGRTPAPSDTEKIQPEKNTTRKNGENDGR